MKPLELFLRLRGLLPLMILAMAPGISATCDPTCLTCSVQSSPTGCSTCKTNATLSSGSCVCNSNYFPNTTSANCLACNAMCVTCTAASATSCTTCSSPNASPTSGTCSCNSGYYPNTTALNCAACNPTCATCSGATASTCLSCLSNATLSSGTCTCNSGFVGSPDSSKCAACDPTCLTCNGTGSTNCVTCPANAALSGTACQCNAGFFLSSSVCTACSSTCATCTTSANNCLTCFSSHASLASGTCSCNNGFYPNTTSANCSPCNNTCATCTGASTCLSCLANATLASGVCSCSTGYFPNTTSATCAACDPTCATCNQTGSSSCLTCYPNATLSVGACSCNNGYSPTPTAANCNCTVPKVCGCPTGFGLNPAGTCVQCNPNCMTCIGTSQTCVTCDASVSNLVGTQCQCLTTAFQSSTGQCLKCDPSCATCSGASTAGCLSCAGNAVLVSTPGVCQCASGYFMSLTSMYCYTCDVSCKTCSGGSASMCTSCVAPAVLSSMNTCGCPPGFFPNTTAVKCTACDSTCKTCANPSASSCTSCFTQAVLSGSSPSSCICQSGSVPNPTSASCGVLNCDITCKSCSGAGITGCLSCFPNAVGKSSTFPTSCLCASGYYPNPNSANCVPCDSSCLTCTSGSPLSCLSCPSGLLLVEGMFCSSACPTGQTSNNGFCTISPSPLAFRLELNQTSSTLIDSVGQAKALTVATSNTPTPYFQQGWLFDGLNDYVLLPPTNAETTRNVVLDTTHYVELWIRPLDNLGIGCLLSKYNTRNQGLNLLLKFCITDTGALTLTFTGTSFSDANAQAPYTLTGGQVPISRVWTLVGYQLQQNSTYSTIATLFTNQKPVATHTFSGVLFKDYIGNVDSAKFVMGAAFSSYMSFSNYFNGSIAELSIYNSLAPSVSLTSLGSPSCTCATCTKGGACLSQCFANEFQSSSGCSLCPRNCTTGCIRSTDCRANVDPLCSVFSSFVGCTTCATLANLTPNGCQCTANAYSVNQTCSCLSGYQAASGSCVQCLNFYTPSQVTAYFDSTFLKILIDFRLPVATRAVTSCSQLFLNATLQKLGTGYICSWSTDGTEAIVLLGIGSTIGNEALQLNYLNLYSNQGVCSFSPVPLVPVAAYRYPFPPVTANLVCPKTFSLVCATGDTLNLDASGSLGGKGRNLTFTWTISSVPTLSILLQYQGYQTSDSVLKIPRVSLSASFLTVIVSVTNFLGSQAKTYTTVNITAGTAISLGIDGGASITLTASSSRAVKVVPYFLCPTTTYLQYSWSFLSSVPVTSTSQSFAFLSNPSPPNTVAIPANTLTAGFTYSFQVSATDGLNTGNLVWNVTVPHSPLVVQLDRTNSQVSASNSFRISGEKSYDPDQSTGNLAYSWSCLEGVNPCTDSNGNVLIQGEVNAVLGIPSSRMKTGASWNITLTISKDTRSASSSVTVNVTAVTGCDFTISAPPATRVNPQVTLQIAYQVSTSLPTSFQWAQIFGNGLTLLTPVTYPFLLIAANTMQSGTIYGFTLTATSLAGSTYAQLYFQANYPPNGGTSIVTPTSGTALQTLFYVLSTNWEDVEGDYPLSYRLTYLYQNYQVPVNTRCLSSSIMIKAGIGQYQLTAEVYDYLNSKTTTQLFITSNASTRLLQSVNVLSAFLADTVDIDQTFPMLLAYSSVYTFDNATYAGVATALQSYVAQIQSVDSSVVDSAIGCVQALFGQQGQMNANSLQSLLNMLTSLLGRVSTPLTDSQLSNLQSVVSQYPGKSANETSELKAFLSAQLSTSATNTLPDQDPSTFSSNGLSSYQRRISTGTLTGLKFSTGNSSVSFPNDLVTALGLDTSTVLDVQASTITYPNSTSDQVAITLFNSGQFVGYSFVQNAQAEVPVRNLSTPITFTVPIRSYQPDLTYQCVYQNSTGQWVSDGVNLTALNAVSASCSSSHLSTFQVAIVVSAPITTTGNAPGTGQTVAQASSCDTNYAPMGIVGAVVIFGVIVALGMQLRDRHNVLQKIDASGIEVSQFKSPTSIDRGVEMFTEKPQPQFINTSLATEGPVNDLPSVETASFLRLLLESHFLIGLCFHSPELKRWSKVLIMTSALITEMCVVGIAYYRHAYQYSHDIAQFWTDYTYTDFIYALVGLAIGFGTSLVLLALFSVAQKRINPTLRIVLNSLGVVLAGGLSAAGVFGTVYMDLDMCFETGGLWAIGFLPIIFGEVIVCQGVLSFGRALALKAVS